MQGTLELTVPLGLPKEIGMTGRIFNDWGVIGKPDGFNANTMVYSNKPRSSVGAGIGWQSPLGYISLDFGWAWLKEEYDDTEVFRLNFGSRF